MQYATKFNLFLLSNLAETCMTIHNRLDFIDCVLRKGTRRRRRFVLNRSGFAAPAITPDTVRFRRVPASARSRIGTYTLMDKRIHAVS